MNDALLEAAKEFDESFLSKFPTIDRPEQLISNFNLALNEFAQNSSEHGGTINAITILLTNPDLEEFASKDSQADRRVSYELEKGYDDEKPTAAEDEADRVDNEIIEEARKVVYGDPVYDEAGLQELVTRLIDDLESERL